MRLPLWVPDGEEGWILSFPSGAYLWFDDDQKTVWGFERGKFGSKPVRVTSTAVIRESEAR